MANAEKTVHCIRCVDCLHAKQHREINEATGRYVLKVRCVKGHWKKGRKHGDCQLYRVLARRCHVCGDYVPMSENDEDRKQYLQALAATLPLEEIVYEPNGRPVDMLEEERWASAQ